MEAIQLERLWQIFRTSGKRFTNVNILELGDILADPLQHHQIVAVLRCFHAGFFDDLLESLLRLLTHAKEC